MDPVKQQLLSRLRPYQQEHVVAFWEDLAPAARERLARQINEVDLELIAQCFGQAGGEDDWMEVAARAESPRAIRLEGGGGDFTDEQARERGAEALRRGKLGVVLVAGGQGTRLGFDHPKGMLPLGPVSRRPLFQILIELLLAVGRRYGVNVPLYLMTSDATHDETVEFLNRHDRFGLAAEDLRIFRQGRMPAVDAQSGEILLAEPGSLFLGPDGHGGMLAALDRHGCLEEARDRGIEQFFYGQVDNPLIRLCDPRIIGCHLLADSEMTTQVVAKSDPLEKVGNVALVDGRLRIIEYSDLPNEAAGRRNADGSLQLWAGSIAVHVFDVEFLRRMAERADALPLHRAKKKAPYVDRSGRQVFPETPNAVKFERFIFDLLPWARNAIVVEEAKEESFAAVKNADGAETETAATAQAAMIAQHVRWLRAAGAVVDDGAAVEINPLWALDAQEVACKIDPGLQVAEDTYFH
jgi:UDP-N-acetylglucosamine/UDP-N-acetylgalactosamine diphosphorylase